MSTTESREDKDARKRLERLLCAIHAWDGITISQGQAIMGGSGNADDLLNYMFKQKVLMKKSNSPNSYEFTHKGLTELYTLLLPKAEKKYGDKITQTQLMQFVISESRVIAGRKP